MRKHPHTSQISFFSWKLPGSNSNPPMVAGYEGQRENKMMKQVCEKRVHKTSNTGMENW